jgi:hypothetical protein
VPVDPITETVGPIDAIAPTTSTTEITAADIMIATHGTLLPGLFDQKDQKLQIIRFGKGIHWMSGDQDTATTADRNSLIVLPCILGDMLDGPMILATGEAPVNVPFNTTADLHNYYKQANSMVVVVNEKMSDNARNLATAWRLNGLFIVQRTVTAPSDSEDVSSLLEKININAVTALAGPQALILVQLGTQYFFYRGIANAKYMDTSNLKFGQDITDLLAQITAEELMDPNWPRLVNLDEENCVYMPKINQTVRLDQLKDTFRLLSDTETREFKDDIVTMMPQLQALLSQDKLQALCSELIAQVDGKVTSRAGPWRKEYANFVTHELDISNAESCKKRENLLANLRKLTKTFQDDVQWLTQALGNIVSTQTTSSRSHDLKRLVRQSTIKGNVETTKLFNFEGVAELLEKHAKCMGIMLVNIDTSKWCT